MTERTLRVLEFTKIREKLAEKALSRINEIKTQYRI